MEEVEELQGRTERGIQGKRRGWNVQPLNAILILAINYFTSPFYSANLANLHCVLLLSHDVMEINVIYGLSSLKFYTVLN